MSAQKNHETIDIIIRQLERAISDLSLEHEQKMTSLIELRDKDFQTLLESFDKTIRSIEESYRERIQGLQEELTYLRELNDSQRMMMHDNVEYIKRLESRLKNSKTL